VINPAYSDEVDVLKSLLLNALKIIQNINLMFSEVKAIRAHMTSVLNDQLLLTTAYTSSSTSSTSLPGVIEFTNLDLTKNLKAAKKALSALAGVYSIICNITGAMYIGSSIDIGNRLVDHLVTKNTNEHLQYAINKYGLDNFSFCVVELYEVYSEVCPPPVDTSQETNKANLLAVEQKHLDWLFSLPKELRYNFSPIAGAPIAGRTHTPESKAQMSYANTGKIHTPESKAQMSDSKSGANNPMFGKTHSDDTRAKISKAMSGANHPMYGKSGELSPLSIQVNVYSLDNVLVRSFSSQSSCSEWLGIKQYTVSRYIKSGKVWNKLYVFRTYIL